MTELSARELLTKLEVDAAAMQARVRTLEHERDRLLPAKHEGDVAAVKRSRAIRAELVDHDDTLRENLQLQRRLQPRLIRERAAAVRQGRVDAAEQLSKLLEVAQVRVAAVDDAIDALVTAMAGVVPVVAAAQSIGSGLVVAQTGDIGADALNRMMVTRVLPDLGDLVEERLKMLDVLPVQSGWKVRVGPLVEALKYGSQSLMARVEDRLATDRLSAEEAAGAVEAELVEREAA